MNAQEAVVICRLVRAACPAQKFDEFTPDMWADMLSGVDFDSARLSIVEIGKRQQWISPADIIAESRRSRPSLPYHRPLREVVADIEAKVSAETRPAVAYSPSDEDRALVLAWQKKRQGNG